MLDFCINLVKCLALSQFASTAKRMKNDPHVTEVSDDGALLRRYRDEIADLKQRLQEVDLSYFASSLSNKCMSVRAELNACSSHVCSFIFRFLQSLKQLRPRRRA